MKKERILSILLCMIMVLTAGAALAGCGGGKDSPAEGGASSEENSGPGTVSSSSGIITIDYTENYEPQVSASSEKITLWKADRKEGENDHFIEIDAAGTDGSIQAAASVCTSYVQGASYSKAQLQADLNNFIAAHPTIYYKPEEITLNGETYIRTECTTNGADSYKIFGSVNGRPVIISVCDDRDSEEVQNMLNTLIIQYAG